jgi:glycosyltransferase involved in cell wall biosynthesis
MPKYSVIIPVFNRPLEIQGLLESLRQQTQKNFEVVVVEDGSTEKCEHIVEKFKSDFPVRYAYRKNSGPSVSRNVGISLASGEYILFFDSDCLLPEGYFDTLNTYLIRHPLDMFGGPDTADKSFSAVQKAINYTMTAFITTGGIRGGRRQLDTFQPRSFNMGLKREVYFAVGGFSNIHPGEDPDLSYRVRKAGYNVGFIPDAYVFHKRRTTFSLFFDQVYRFGVVRVILAKWHRESLRLVYFLPTTFLLGSMLCLILGLMVSIWFLLPLLFFAILLFTGALLKEGDLIVSLLSILAGFIQLTGYGIGYLYAFIAIRIMKLDEKKVFKKLFFEPGNLGSFIR